MYDVARGAEAPQVLEAGPSGPPTDPSAGPSSGPRGSRGQAKQALLARLKGAQGAEPGRGRTRIPRRPAGMAKVPLSAGQEQLWFLEQLAPEAAAYNVPVVLRLEGMLDRPALQRALDALVARHESLRTAFVVEDGVPFQLVGDPRPFPLTVSEPDHLDPDGAEAELRRLAAGDAARPLPLQPHAPLRGRLVRLTGRLHFLVVTAHHVIFDGWSLGVFVRELAAMYEQEVSGSRGGLAELPVQYPDYALWQRERLDGERMAELEAYWRSTLEAAPISELAGDRPRPPVQRFEGASELIELPGGLMAEVEKLTRAEGATPFQGLLAAFCALLCRYGCGDEVMVGTPSANRSPRELEPLIGYFVNMLPVRVDLTGDPTFLELLGRVREVTVAAQMHQELPLVRVMELLRLERDPSRSPLFQVGFTFESDVPSPVRAAGIEIRVVPDLVPASASKLDLGVFAQRSGDRLHLRSEYATALFDSTTVRRMLAHLGVLIGSAVGDPARRLSELDVLTEAERRRQLVEWNATTAPVPDRCVHELFEAQVARAPEATAAVSGEDSLTYAELDRAANRLARHLRSLGVGPDVLVGVCLGRGLPQLVGVLGVLKAGGAYLPLDPAYPPARLGFMLEDARVAVVVAEKATEAAVAAGPWQVVCLEREQDRLDGLDAGPLGRVAGPRNLAYVLYTSGSTGRPKGALVEHRSVVDFVTSVVERFEVGPADRVLQYASLGFDSSVFEIFTGLAAGATVCLAPDEARLSPGRLAEVLRSERITVTDLPPAVMALLDGGGFPDLRVALVGGEPISAELVRDWARPGRRFFNGYGPTEATVAVTLMECEAGAEQPPPIGWVMPNHQLFVLDPHGNPVPIGVAGELYVGGVGLARGYLNRPELTRERFVQDHLGGSEGGVLYRTGDLVRQLPDGCLVFLGRMDHQVKIGGVRIELGEIESVLLEHPGIAQAVVIARDDGGEGPQLVAYLVASSGAGALTAAELRRHLERQLPSSMVPARFVVLDAFPLNASGKVDRSALPAPAAEGEGEGNGDGPRTLLEAVLVDLFAEVLGVEAIGVDDGFFELGGSSLQAMRLLYRLGEDLDVDLAVAEVFQAPTVARLAELLRDAHGVVDQSLAGPADEPGAGRLPGEAEPVRLAGRAAPDAPGLTDAPTPPELVFCVHAAGGTVVPYLHLARGLQDVVTVYGLPLDPHVATGPPSAEELASRHTASIRRLQPRGPYRLCGWSLGGVLAFEVARQLEAVGEEVGLLVLLDPPYPGRPAEAPSEWDLAGLYVTELLASCESERDLPAGFASWPLRRQLSLAAKRIGACEGGLPEATDQIDQMERAFLTFRRNVDALHGYRPGPVSAPTLLLWGARSHNVDGERTWGRLLTGSVRRVKVVAGHHDLLVPPAVGEVTAAVRASLRRGRTGP